MKKLIITFAALFAALVSLADTIDRQQAQVIAQRWLGTEVTEAASGSDAFYVFNGKDGGWIIISADDVATPVLGYNDTGSLDPDRLPSNVKHWIGGYEKEISEARAEKRKSTSEVKALWKTAGYRTKAAGGKLLETPLWDQYDINDQKTPYYNYYCPEVTEKNGKKAKAVTGCVATAMAEVLRYHEWPAHGTGTIGGYTYDSDYGKKVTIDSYSIDSHNYDYSLMPFEPKDPGNSDQRNAIAQLMHDCGVMVEAYYNFESGTGAYAEDIVNALVNHMSYSASAYHAYRQSYTDAEWTKMLEKEIDEGRPVIYGGADSDSGGHQFVCDGYDSSDYIHINWGWSGNNNGYFTLTLKIPGKYTFSEGQSGVFDLKPDPEGDDVPMGGPLQFYSEDSKATGFYLQSGSVLSKSFTVAVNAIWNTNYYVGYSGPLKVALVDWKGSLKEYISDDLDIELDPYNIITITDITCAITGDVRFGDRVVMHYKNSAGVWEMLEGHSIDGQDGKTYYVASSIPAVDASFILTPEDPKAGDTYFFELVPGSSIVKSVTWYYDDKKQEGITANLTAGTHTVKASVTYTDGTKENLTAQIIVR